MAPPPPVPPLTLRLYVSPAVSELVTLLTSTYSHENPSISFEIVVGSELRMLESVQTDPQGYLITNYLNSEKNLWVAPLGLDGIGLITHISVGVRELTLTQVQDIYGGRIKRWNDIGGTDIEVIPFMREEGAGIRDNLIHYVLGETRIDSNTRIAPSDNAMKYAIERTPGAIGYIPISQVNSGRSQQLVINGVVPSLEMIYTEQYPLRTPLYIAGLHEPSADHSLEQHFRAFIGWVQSPAGQSIVSQRVAPLPRDAAG